MINSNSSPSEPTADAFSESSSELPCGQQAPLVELKGISKQFGSTRVLTHIDFTLNAGEATAIIG
ncbi:MAG: hypothetical protein WBD47_08405, partial [Phormidesmis sp.]